MGKAKVADASEVLEALTSILRKEEEVKPGEVLRAAELLGKRYRLFGEQEERQTDAPRIVMDIPKRKGGSE